jgi:hypothetical protein
MIGSWAPPDSLVTVQAAPTNAKEATNSINPNCLRTTILIPEITKHAANSTAIYQQNALNPEFVPTPIIPAMPLTPT